MSPLERRLVFFGAALLFLAFAVWATGGGRFPTSVAQASSKIPNCIVLDEGCFNLAYYGADISTNGGMDIATGVQSSSPNTRPSNGPWPQYTGNYCFIAVVQALANYQYWKDSEAIPYPHQVNQGPLDDKPNDAVATPLGPEDQAYQILYDMQHSMVDTADGGPVTGSFTAADISKDFGGDPRAQAYAAWFETPNDHMYHQYIYHTGVDVGTYGLGKGVAFSHWNGTSPEIAIVAAGAHSVVIAGIWSYGNPASIPDAAITSLAVYNPWDQNWGSYLSGAYYTQVSYGYWTAELTGAPNYWWGQTYDQDGHTGDPDPAIGIYKPNSTYPQHWIGYYVSIQRDDDFSDNANYCHDENGNVMYHP